MHSISYFIASRSFNASLSEDFLLFDELNVYFIKDLCIFLRDPTLPKSSNPYSLSINKIRSTATLVKAHTKILVSLSSS